MSAALFPSGEWTGFYVYSRQPNRFLMDLVLTFTAGKISGGGWDGIGSFDILGAYCEDSMECSWTKQYHGQHSLDYRGFREGKGIWGTWRVGGGNGGFHIWPLGANGDETSLHEVVEEQAPAGTPVGARVKRGLYRSLRRVACGIRRLAWPGTFSGHLALG